MYRYTKPILPLPEQTVKMDIDKFGNVWIDTFGGKTYMFEYHSNRWEKHKNLAFQFEQDDGTQWFISKDNKLVYFTEGNWYAYDQHDGVIEAPVRIIQHSNGQLWCAGSHNGRAAIAYLESSKWHQIRFPDMAWGIEKKAVFEDSSGNLWFGGALFANGDGGTCKVSYTPEGTIEYGVQLSKEKDEVKLHNVYGGFFELPGDRLFAASFYWLFEYIDDYWVSSQFVKGRGPITSVLQMDSASFLFGTTEKGVYSVTSDTVEVYNSTSVLKTDAVLSMAAFSPTQIWIAIEEDYTFFDGENWINDVFPKDFLITVNYGEIIANKRNNTLWINPQQKEWVFRAASGETSMDNMGEFYSLRYKGDTLGPDTYITVFQEEVDVLGNTFIEWSGIDYWNTTSQSDLQYSFKLNDQPWSRFSPEKGCNFLNLESGNYTLWVRSMDKDLNVDATPAVIHFRVLQPIYKRGWFIGVNIGLLLVIVYLAINVIARNNKLAHVNISLNRAYKYLESQKNEIEIQNKALADSREESIQLNDELHETNTILIQQKEELSLALENLQKTQAQLIQSEKMASVGVLTAGIAHEINNPLNFISGGMEAISEIVESENISSKAEIVRLLGMIDEGIRRTADIVRSLNRFSRTNESLNEHCDIHSILDNCLIILNNQIKNRITLTRNYSDAQAMVAGNEGKLHQVFLNILTNAEQAILNQGTIDIQTEVNATEVVIQILDSGTGISEKYISKITDPFFTTKAPGHGTGMGLFITYQIIKEHLGTLKFDSTLGEGTRVTIVLPVQRNKNPRP